MHRKVDRIAWIAATMSVLLALECVCGDGNIDTTTTRVRHRRSNQGNSSTEQLEREFRRNVNIVQSIKWRCDEPKPRLVYFSEATGPVPDIPPHSVWLADATVLHRCEEALGCCNAPRKCRPEHFDVVKITFKTLHMGTGVPQYPKIEFHNHTRCACMDT